MLNFIRKYPFGVALRHVVANNLTQPVSSFIPDKYFLVNYRGGKIYLNLRESVMMRQRALGVYEYWKTRIFTNFIKVGMTVVDIGVNKGYFSLLAAKLMHDCGRVLSFEPNPDNCYWIRRSIEANNYKAVKLFELALSDKEGEATFYPGKRSGWGSLYFYPVKAEPDQKPITVKTATLDDILSRQDINGVDLIKIDVEGAELLVLKGAEETLKKAKNVKLLMDIDLKDDGQRHELFDFLRQCGFKVFKIGKVLRPIQSINGAVRDIYAAKT